MTSLSNAQLRHVFGVETKGANPVFNLSPLLTSLNEPILAASASFWAIPWVGGGGPVYVSPISAAGKVGAPPLFRDECTWCKSSANFGMLN